MELVSGSVIGGGEWEGSLAAAFSLSNNIIDGH